MACSRRIAITAVSLALGACSSAGPLSEEKDWLTVYVDHQRVPSEYYEGTYAGYVFVNGVPNLLIVRDGAKEQRMWITPFTVVSTSQRCIGTIAKGTTYSETEYRETGVDYFTGGRPLLGPTGINGTDHVCGAISQVGDKWVAMSINLQLSPEHQAELAAENAAKARAAADRKRAEDERTAQAEAARKQKVAQWRALKQRPPLPEGARKYQVLADDALNDKNFEAAANYYNQALAIEPLWPEAQYNVALIDGELRRYAQAAAHMRFYLELVPNASDAQAVQDKIIIWEEKAKAGGGK